MTDLLAEITDKGTALYLAVDPADRNLPVSKWAKTTVADDLVTIDWDAQGRVIGVEVIGSAARSAIDALLQAITDYPARDADSVRQAIQSLSDH